MKDRYLPESQHLGIPNSFELTDNDPTQVPRKALNFNRISLKG